MQIQTFPKHSVTVRNQVPTPPPGGPEKPEPPKDEVNLNQEPGIRYGAVAIAGGAVAGCATLGALAGLKGGVLSEIAAWGSIPGLAIGGALLGGIAAEKFGPSSSDYRAIGGAMLGGLAGGVAGVAQGIWAGGAGSPALATTLGISGALMGVALLFKVAASEN